MALRRSYIDALDGQMHVTEAGDGPPIILLPWFPRSALMYMGEMEVFASLGYRAVALDLMGRGNSVTQNHSLSIRQHADNVEAVLAAMALEKPVIVGGHYSSQVAVELASRPNVGAGAVVIDGGVLITDAYSQSIVDKMARVKPALLPQEDGSHRAFLWDNAVNIFDIYAPGYPATPETSIKLYQHIYDYLAAYLQTGGEALQLSPIETYPFAAKLEELKIPGIFLSAETETLYPALQPMLDIYGGPSQQHVFKGDHPIHFPARAGEYARALCEKLNVYSL